MSPKHFSGWRAGLARCTAVAGIVTAINITFLIVAIPRLEISSPGSREGALFSGDCKKAKRYNIWLHLIINLLASALLAAGNYTQQVLTAPTRNEIDIAHSQRQWLDIGVSSLHNLRHISGKRVTAWILLGLTSVPIHLFYNSTISFETGANRYSIYPATWNDLNNRDHVFPDEGYKALRNTLDEFERLENHECIAAYGSEFISGRSDVIPILDPSTPDRLRTYTIVRGGDPMNHGIAPYQWICGKDPWADCDISLVNAKNWSIYAEEPNHIGGETMRVEYCLSKQTPEQCKLILSIPLLGVVVGCNLLKLVGLALTWLCLENHPLLTLGVLDQQVENEVKKLLTIDQMPYIHFSRIQTQLPTVYHCYLNYQVNRCNGKPGLGCGFRQSIVGQHLFHEQDIHCMVTIGVASFLLMLGMEHISERNIIELWNRGFGRVSLDTLIDFHHFRIKGLVSMVLISNLPQLILSLLYTALNGMWTAMLVGVEWNSYGSRYKSLRTTYPVGQQRKTYWLSLPLRYGVPLIMGSAIMHWFISQSIFFVNLALYQDEKRYYPREGNTTTCGYSPIAIIFSIGLGCLILLITVAWSLRTTKAAIPLGGTCSAVVSAACHRPEGDEYGASELVKWGVVAREDGRQRCSITSWSVEAPECRKWYQ